MQENYRWIILTNLVKTLNLYTAETVLVYSHLSILLKVLVKEKVNTELLVPIISL